MFVRTTTIRENKDNLQSLNMEWSDYTFLQKCNISYTKFIRTVLGLKK